MNGETTNTAKTSRPKTLNQILLNSLKYGKGITLNLDKEERSTLKFLLRELLKLLSAEPNGSDEVKIIRPKDIGLFTFEEEALKRILQKVSRDDLLKG